MRNHGFVAIAIVGAFAVAAPAASAQLGLPLQATYNDHFNGRNGTPACPGGAVECGSGTAVGLGSFTDSAVFDENAGTLTRTLTFPDGNTLVLEETFLNFSPRSPAQVGVSFGHPGNLLLGWTASGTGDFAGADGSGTDDQNQAGDRAHGFIGGSI